MRIIFLDIDGVLNSKLFCESDRYNKHNGCIGIDPLAVEMLNEITDSTGASIVLSSSWRVGKSLDQIGEIFDKYGITGELIGMTGRSDSRFRGVEIYEWMLYNQDKTGSYATNYKDYIILDDESDMLLWQKDNFFQTDGYVGLTPTMVYKIKNFFN